MAIRNRSSFVPLVGLALLFALLVACSGEESTWDRVQRSGVLRVGLDPTYPPFEAFDGTSLFGIDVDLAEALAAELDLAVEFSHFGFDGLYDALATKQVDVLISALNPDISRTRDFAYSDSYFDGGLVLVSSVARPYHDASELKDRTLAVELGAAGHVQATTWMRQVEDLTVSTFLSADEALQALAAGDVDAAVVDNVTFRLFDAAAADANLTATQLSSEPYAMVVRRDDDRLLSELNAALAVLRESGRLDVILDSWLTA